MSQVGTGGAALDPAALSLAWRTDLFFARFDGELLPRPGHLVVRTPANPGFWWGNFLLFKQAPVWGDAARWLALFETEIAAHQPGSRHVAFGVDTPDAFALPRDFAAAGFTLQRSVALTMRPALLRPASSTLDTARFAIERLALPAQAAEAVALHVATDEGAHRPVADYRLFHERQMARYGAMARAGLGDWFGVTAAGQGLVADCGLFGENGLGRFQHVSTHPQWRRRGLCTALIHAVCRHGFEVLGLDELVIVADPDDAAIRIYEALGFERGGSSWQIQRPPPEAAA